MKLTNYLFKTMKETPKDAEFKSHKLLLRGGYIKQVSAGIFTYYPIALKALKKIENIIREEMDATGCNEINMPVVLPATLWIETGRYDSVGDELLRITDRADRKMLLAMTHEEAVTDLIRNSINSYKQLPVKVYQLQTKFRDEPRVRGGLIRVREFIMKDAYSFHDSQADLDKYYDEVYNAYHRIYQRCGLPVIAVSSDVGMMGGSKADEFMAVTEAGEDTLIICSKCSYKANKEVARAKRDYKKDAQLELKEVHTPGKMSIADVSSFLNVKAEQTLKAVVYSIGKDLVMCVIRGDLDVNETKLKNLLKTKQLFLATDEELKTAGIVKGFASPIGMREKGIKIIACESVVNSSNLVTGSNKTDYHTINSNYGRDYTADYTGDISSVTEGEWCPDCGSPLNVKRGIEVGNTFKLGTKYSAAMKARYLDKDGKEKDMIMGCYGIGVGRLLASVLEVCAQEDKLVWPISIAPFEVEFIGLFKENEDTTRSICEDLYKSIKERKIDVIYDNRYASPGFKFKDSELIGAPIVVTVGEKSLQAGGAEITVNGGDKRVIPLDKVISEINNIREALYKELNK